MPVVTLLLEAEARGSYVQGLLELQTEFKANLDNNGSPASKLKLKRGLKIQLSGKVRLAMSSVPSIAKSNATITKHCAFSVLHIDTYS